ncbi:uncharacterized protein LOC108909753 [Anoplophora glabripennis]|uniref:uncharacterized protein LOC108909753 n=1 Tax=Anoplophora glabripennis TaxID=217634 RepID=UPI000873EAAB|nr:uncharacterized protein LOC108909753 [Anoplophora glabripennis]
MKLLAITILYFLVLILTLAAELSYAVPIQQYVPDDRYETYQTDEDNEVLTSNELGLQGTRSDDTLVGPVAYAEFEQGQRDREILQSDEARNYYRPYVRYRQISKRRTSVPVNRRYDEYPGYSLSGYASNRDRFPTVA